MLARSSIALAVSSVGLMETMRNCLSASPMAVKSSCNVARMAALSSSKSRGRSRMLVMFSPHMSVMRLMMALRRKSLIWPVRYIPCVPTNWSTKRLGSAICIVYWPKPRRRTSPRSVSRRVIGSGVPHFMSVNSRMLAKNTSAVKISWPPVPMRRSLERIGRLAVVMVCRPGSKRSRDLPSR